MRYAVIDQAVPNGAVPANVVSVADTDGNPPAVQAGQGLVCDPPASVAAGWTFVGGTFVPPATAPSAADLSAYAAAARYTKETAGISVGGSPIETDRDSQALITGAYSYVSAKPDATISFKSEAGFVILTAAQIEQIALAVGAHVQACFAAEAQIESDIQAGKITTTAQIDAAIAAVAV